MSTGNKVLKKVKGFWVAVALFGAVGFATPQMVSAQVDEVSIEFVKTSNLATQFEGKEDLLTDDLIQDEMVKALESTNKEWVGLTLDETKAEIERQLGVFNVDNEDDFELSHYVIQWGDTLSVLAEAFNIDINELAELNDIKDQDLILTGDVLFVDGVLEFVAESSSSEGVTNATTNPEVAKPTPSQPSKPTPSQPNKPDTNKPNTDNPSEETPKPEEPKPEEPKPEEPKPEEPKPEEPKPEEPKPEEPKPEEPKPEEPKPEEPKPEEPTPEEPSEELPTDEVVESEHVVGEVIREVIGTEEVDSDVVGRTGEEYVEGDVTISEGPLDIQSNEYQDPPTYEKVEKEVPLFDEEGNPLLDEEGNQLFDVVVEEVEIPGAWHYRSLIYATSIHTTTPRVRLIYDNTLPEGVEIEEFAGVAGVSNVTRVQEVIDGDVVDEFEDVVVVVEMQDRVIRIGTKPAGNIKETTKETQVITQGKKIIKDPNKWEDFVEVIPGKAGSIVKVYETLYTQDGKVLSTVEVSEDVVEAEYDVTIVGTKPIKGQKTVTDTVEVPFETEVREVDSYGKEERVIQEGVNGSKEVTTIIHTEKGVEVSREVVGEEITKAPVNKIVEVGKGNLSSKEVKETETIAFNKVTRNNPNMLEGETKVVQKGKNGVMTYIYKVELKDGVEVSRQLVGKEITTEAVDEITEVGTKSRTQTQLRSEQEIIEPTIIERNNPNMYMDEMKVVQEGSNGVLVITFEDTYEDGKLIGTKEIKREVKVKPVDRIIEVGTKLREGEQERDLELVRQEFHRILNDHRVSLGKSELVYYDVMQEGADLRAYEVRADGGFFSHTRPDGTSQSTVYKDIKDVNGGRFVVGENILYRGWYDHQSEKDIALDMFNQFKNSPGHYANMINDNYSGQALGLHVNEKKSDSYNWTYISMAQSLIMPY